MSDYLKGGTTEIYLGGHLIGTCERFEIDDPILQIEEVDLLGTEDTQQIRIRQNISGTIGEIVADWERLALVLGHVYYDTTIATPVEDFITQDGDFNQKIVLGQPTGSGTGKKIFNDISGSNESKLSQAFIARAKTVSNAWLKLNRTAAASSLLTLDPTLIFRVYSDAAGHSGPSTTVYAESDDSLTASDLTTTYTWYSQLMTMDATNDELTVGTKYWLVCEFDAETGDDGTSDYIRWQAAGANEYDLEMSRYGPTSTLLSEYSDSAWAQDEDNDAAFILEFTAKYGTVDVEKGFEVKVISYDADGNSKLQLLFEGVRFYSGDIDVGAGALVRADLSWKAKSLKISKS